MREFNLNLIWPSTKLTIEEEQRLSNWIVAKAKLGFSTHPDEMIPRFKKY